jgi:hypothetical protein
MRRSENSNERCPFRHQDRGNLNDARGRHTRAVRSLREASLTQKQPWLAMIRPDRCVKALHRPELSLLSSVLGIHLKSCMRECGAGDCEGRGVSPVSKSLNPVPIDSEQRKRTTTLCFVLVILQGLTERHSDQILFILLGMCRNETEIGPGQLH